MAMSTATQLRKGLQSQEANTLFGREFPRPELVEEKHIWSTYAFTGTAAPNPIVAGVLQQGDYTLFTSTVGQNGQGLPSGLFLDERDTNFPGQGGNIPAGYNYVWREFGASVLAQRPDVVTSVGAGTCNGPPSMSDVDQLLNGIVIILKRNNVEINLGPAAWWPQPGGPVNVGTTILDEAAASGAVAGPPAYTTGGLSIDTAGNYQERWVANSGALPPSPGTRRRLKVPLILRGQDQFFVIARVSRPITLNTILQGGTVGFSLRTDFYGAESSPVPRT